MVRVVSRHHLEAAASSHGGAEAGGHESRLTMSLMEERSSLLGIFPLHSPPQRVIGLSLSLIDPAPRVGQTCPADVLQRRLSLAGNRRVLAVNRRVQRSQPPGALPLSLTRGHVRSSAEWLRGAEGLSLSPSLAAVSGPARNACAGLRDSPSHSHARPRQVQRGMFARGCRVYLEGRLCRV